jgi:murein DD-endopeptidase MepM/ murein hydrolase activator NlpD
MTDLDAAKAQLTIRLQNCRTPSRRRRQAQAEAQQELEAAAAKAKADAAKVQIDELVADRSSALRDAKERAPPSRSSTSSTRPSRSASPRSPGRPPPRRRAGGTAGVPIQIGPAVSPGRRPAPRVSGNVGPRIHPVYGYRSCHTGADISAGWAPILSAADGVVVSVENGGPYGLHTLIQHGSGISTMYAHQSATSVSPGQKVTQGQIIGNVGSTGWSHRSAPALRGARQWHALRSDGLVRRGEGSGLLLMVKESGRKLITVNRRARHDYAITDTYEAGIWC